MDAALLGTLALLQGALLLGLALFAWGRGPARQELRLRLFEAMAAAARRGIPLAPVAERAATETNRAARAALVRLAEDLESGMPLCEALDQCRLLRVPARTIAAIRASDGTVSLAGALEAAVRDETASRVRRRRPYADLLYLGVILGLATPFAWSAVSHLGMVAQCLDVDRFGAGGPTITMPAPAPSLPVAVLAFVATGLPLCVLLARRFLPRATYTRLRGLGPWSVVAEIPPLSTPARLAGAGRFFDGVGAGLRAGLPLSESVRAAADATGVRTVRRGALALADAVDRGAPATEAWAHLAVVPSLRVRAAAACSVPAAAAAASFERIAEECRSRLDAWVAARARWIVPAGLLVLGAGAFWIHHELAQFLAEVRNVAGRAPW